MPLSTTTPSSRIRPKPKSEPATPNNGCVKTRLKLSSPDPTKRSLRDKSRDEESVGLRKKAGDEKRKVAELEGKLEEKEGLISQLESQVLILSEKLEKALKLNAELDKVLNFNAELQFRNKKLADSVAAAQATIASLTTPQKPAGEHSSKFKDIQKLIADKLEHSRVKKETILDPSPVKTPPPPNTILRVAKLVQRDVARPPPPPPPPRTPAPTRKASPIVQSARREGKQDPGRNHNKPAVSSVHSSIVGEIQNRSAHLMAIRADIETRGEFINGLIQKVLSAAYTDIEDVLKFVDCLDSELASLADERAVLKHFKWPERKADAMREAAIEYRDLKKLEIEISSYVDVPSTQCAAALKKMASLLDKAEQSIQRLIKLRNSVIRSYQEFKIPVDWMLDSGIPHMIKQASTKLVKTYIKRVMSSLDRESTQESLLLQGVQFAYRGHQFVGGLDSETLCAFEEIRQLVPGSRHLLPGIPSS